MCVVLSVFVLSEPMSLSAAVFDSSAVLFSRTLGKRIIAVLLWVAAVCPWQKGNEAQEQQGQGSRQWDCVQCQERKVQKGL